MLKQLKLQDVGPGTQLDLELKARLNFLTGDNGLGKTFLLDVAWWALTRTWARRPVMPCTAPTAKPKISFRYDKRTPSTFDSSSTFDRRAERWTVKPGRPPIPGMVIYAQVDGGFSVWDPARNYWADAVAPDRPQAFIFKPGNVWDGLQLETKILCEGLVRDWGSWQRENNVAFQQLTRVLAHLSPSHTESLKPGKLPAFHAMICATIRHFRCLMVRTCLWYSPRRG